MEGSLFDAYSHADRPSDPTPNNTGHCAYNASAPHGGRFIGLPVSHHRKQGEHPVMWKKHFRNFIAGLRQRGTLRQRHGFQMGHEKLEMSTRQRRQQLVVQRSGRGPFVGGRIIDVSQAAAHELGFADLTKVCLKIQSIPEDRPADEN
jgi:hypothetical protein